MKKTLLVLLAIAMVFVLAACTGTGNKEVLDDDYYENATYTTGSQLGCSEWDGSLPLIPEGEEYTVTIGVNTSPNVLDYENIDFINWLEEQTGVNIELLQFPGSSTDRATQFSLMITGGEKLPDIMVNTGLALSETQEFGREGLLMNTCGYLQKQSPYTMEILHQFYPDQEDYDYMMKYLWAKIGDKIDNKTFHYPSLAYHHIDNVNTQVMINMDWLEAVGMEKPTTVEELYDVLVAFRDQDPNGNGLKDEIPMLGQDKGRQGINTWLINAFIQFHYDYKFCIEDGEIFSPYHQDEYREAMKFINKLVKEGLLSELCFSAGNSDIANLLNPDEGQPYTVGVCAGNIDGRYAQGHDSIYVYEPLAPLKDATGRGGYGLLYIDTFEYPIILSNTIERPEIAWRLLDFMSCGESYLRQRWGARGVSWDWLDEGVDGEGMGNLGGTARFKLINPDTFGTPNNETWCMTMTQRSETYWQYYMDDTTDPWIRENCADQVECYSLYEQAGQPEDMFYIFVRIPEEEGIYYEYTSELLEYLNKARAEFGVGRKDPNNDADWQEYLDGLYKLNFQESWLDVADACWARFVAENK